MFRKALATIVIGSTLFTVGCLGVTDDAGQAMAEITSVPTAVRCIRLNVKSDARSVEQKFSVTSGQSATLTLNGLPTGNVVFVGDAFSQTCNNVAASTSPTWSSDPTYAYLTAGSMVNVPLVFRKATNVTVTVDFVEGAGPVDGGSFDGPFPSPWPSFDLSGPIADGGTAFDLSGPWPSPGPSFDLSF